MSKTERRTLDQQRASFAWQSAVAGCDKAGDEYRRAAKSSPALVMSSGLMPTLAYLYAKDGAHRRLCDDLCRWLRSGHGEALGIAASDAGFAEIMNALHGCRSEDYLRATDEILELLKWLRQYADAVAHAGATA